VNSGHLIVQSVNMLSCLCTNFYDFLPGANFCYESFLESGVKCDHTYKNILRFQQGAKVYKGGLSLLAIKSYGSSVVYFGLWLGVTLCRRTFLVALDTTT